MDAGCYRVWPDCEVVIVVVADGGEGTVNAVVNALQGEKVTALVHDPLGREITAEYGLVKSNGFLSAVVEMSAASGLPLLNAAERNPMRTSTYGTGELILDAMNRGCRHFLVGIGGSATNDAGTGMLTALGFKFFDAHGEQLDGCGATLGKIAAIDDSSVPEEVFCSNYVVACDVDTTFCGMEGAAYVFAPQKGASPSDVETLDAGMRSLAELIRVKYHTDIRPISGAGAAGGLGGAFKVFLNATLTKGIDMVFDVIGFDHLLEGADLVITGEGKLDFQTAKGKTAAGVLRHARLRNVPVVAIGGAVEACAALDHLGFADLRCVNDPGTPLELAMQKDFAKKRIQRTVEKMLNDHNDKSWCRIIL